METREPIRILFVVDALWVGGTERSIVEMLPLLSESGISSTIAFFRRHQGETLESEAANNGAELKFLQTEGLYSQVKKTRRLLREVKPDILHTSLFRANLVGRIAALGNRVTVVNSLVNTPYEPIRLRDPRIRPWRMRIVQLVDSLTARLSVDHFHAVSTSVKKSAIKRLRLSPSRITVVERGRDPERLGQPSAERCQLARRQFGVDSDQQLLVAVGRHEYQKGLIYLLEAVKLLLAQYPKLKLHIAGRRGFASAELEESKHRLGLEHHVEFLGHRDDIPEVLAGADLFVLPSLYEGLPGAVIEAMALGLPIVASNIGPVRELVEADESALLVDPCNPEALAEAIGSLIQDTAWASRIGTRAMAVFAERFTVEGLGRKMADFYQTLLSERS